MAAELGFEPRQTESESAVLPLHNSAMSLKRAFVLYIICSCLSSGFFIFRHKIVKIHVGKLFCNKTLGFLRSLQILSLFFPVIDNKIKR